MEQGLEQLQWSRRKVQLLEQSNARQEAYTQPGYQWNFKVAVSCPPSTIIHMRGGQVWGDPEIWSGRQWYVESASFDLADEADIGYHYTFDDAYYYKPLAVMLRWSGYPASPPYPLYIRTSAEYATGALAEEAAYPVWPSGGIDPNATYGIPLGIFIMRNNGNTTAQNQFMPIDRVNRGRSYLFRDVKLRFQW